MSKMTHEQAAAMLVDVARQIEIVAGDADLTTPVASRAHEEPDRWAEFLRELADALEAEE